MQKLKWGIIGLGKIAHQFLSEFQQEDEGEIVGVASRSADKAADFAKQYQVPKSFGSYEALLADEDIDVVYIATPHNFHFEWIMKALAAGKHVLCEKPITMTTKELTQAMALAKQNNLVLMEAMTLYHVPFYSLLKVKIAEGKLGKLQNIQIGWGFTVPYDAKSRLYDPKLAGGSLMDVGIYGLSYLEFMMSSTPRLCSSVMKRAKSGVDGESMLIFENDDHEIASMAISMFSPIPKKGVLNFENGYVDVVNFSRADHGTIVYNDGTSENLEFGDGSKAMNNEVTDMQRIIRGDQANTTLIRTLHTMELLTAIRKSWHESYPFEDPTDF